MNTDEDMPLSALPYFLRISLSFCNAIDESIEIYKDDQDRTAFSKILDHLSSDLGYYIKVYQMWEKSPEAQVHKADLAALGRHLHDAQKLLSSAVELIRH